MKIILDFDDVLFNATAFKRAIFKRLTEYGISGVEDLYVKERESGQPFSLRHFLTNIFEQQRGSSIGASIIYRELMETCEAYVNQELALLVRFVGKDNCFIVTNGNQEFQKDKILRTKMNALVSKYTIVSGSKKEEIESLCKEFSNEEIIFVDDKSKFFADLNMEVCKNLKTVMYNEYGLENLQAEIRASRDEEQNRKIPNNIPQVQVPKPQMF